VNAPGNCGALPLNQCGSRTECATCTGSTLNSSTTLQCGWCETDTTATCLPSSRCANTGGTVAPDCAAANPCIGHASCTECFAAGTCSWCEGDTDSVCVRDDGQTQCPGGGYQNITDCVDVSPCFSHMGCTACSGEPAGCEWCQDFFTQAQSCVINCQGGPTACPTGASPQQAPAPAKAPVIGNVPSPATVVPSPMVVTVPTPAITNAPSDQSTTAAPSAQTTVAPSDQTTVAPSDQTTAAPSALTTGASPMSVTSTSPQSTTTSTTGISPSKATIAPTPRAAATTVGSPPNTSATTVAFSLSLVVIAALVSL